MRGIAIFSGNSHPSLTNKICEHLSVPTGRSTLAKFSNRETNVKIDETVRDLDVFIVQSSCGNVNDNFMELLIMISACRTASAKKITAVIPCFPYARHTSDKTSNKKKPVREDVPPLIKANSTPDHSVSSPSSSNKAENEKTAQENPFPPVTEARKAKVDPETPEAGLPPHPFLSTPSPRKNSEDVAGRRRVTSISTSQPNIAIANLTPPQKTQPRVGTPYKRWTARPGTLVANTLVAAGCDHVITMDLHDPQFQGYFDIPLDNLYSHPLIIKYIKEKIPKYKNAVIVSPDAGGAKRSTLIADKLQMEFALIHKERVHNGPRGADMMLVGDVSGKSCIIIDDMSDTAETICSASQVLVEKGATKVVAIITHGILSGDSLERINKSSLQEVIVSNTVPQDEHLRLCKKIRVMDVTSIFAEAIRRIHNGESVSFLADIVPY